MINVVYRKLYEECIYVLEIECNIKGMLCTYNYVNNLFKRDCINDLNRMRCEVMYGYIIFKNEECANECAKWLNAKLFLMKRMTV